MVLGVKEGEVVGDLVPFIVGVIVGYGEAVGLYVGHAVVGPYEGKRVGLWLGTLTVGLPVGFTVGLLLGTLTVGSAVGTGSV